MTAAEARFKVQAILGCNIDGAFGPKTRAAFDGLATADSDSTWPPTLVPVSTDEPEWLKIARRELGTTEIPGSKDNPRIVEYHTACALHATDDETPWCSAFVNWCLRKAGKTGTRNAMARSFLEWGTKMDRPRIGCIVVFSRGAAPAGHVAFCVGIDGDRIKVLGGNQGNKVSIVSSSTVSVLSYRWPV